MFIKALIYITLPVVLASVGVYPNQWQFWAIQFLVVALDYVSHTVAVRRMSEIQE